MQTKLSLHASKGCSSQVVAAYVVFSHRGKVFHRGVGGGSGHGANGTTEERVRLGRDALPEIYTANRVQILTVLQSQCITTSATVHRSPGLHQTAAKICRRELTEDNSKITMWDFIFLQCLLDNYSHHSELHFPVMKPLIGLLSACRYVCVLLPPVPFQNALKPSSLRIFLKQSMTPLYDVWPARAATWSLVLMTSAGVTSEAAGTP